MQISEFLRAGDIVLGLVAPSKERLLQALAESAARSTGLSPAAILTALVKRETLGSTGMGQGIAIPHATLEGLGKPFGLLARLGKPVDFEAVDEAPVDLVFLLLNPASGPSAGLGALSCVARALRDAEVVKYARSSDDPRAIHERVVAGSSC